MKVIIATLIMFVTLSELEGLSSALNAHKLRLLATKHNVTSILVFGDSSVDPGNNNILGTDMKGNFPPYGKSFFGGRATGRLCDGRLATDFIAEAVGFPPVAAFLDRNRSRASLLHGVSFASAASGYDDLTANISGVFSFPKQVNYFMHYKLHLNKLVGRLESDKFINNAIFVLSMGSNDFLQNYFVDDVRKKQFTVPQYIDFLSSRMLYDAQMLYKLGGRRLVVVGVPPMGCMPLMKTLRSQDKCVDQLNDISFTFNTKIKNNLALLHSKLGLKSLYVDAYSTILNAIRNPLSYGLRETTKGCCGTGTFEYGESCKGMKACEDPSKYVFWDAVHPTQRMYQIIVEKAIASLSEDFLV